MSRSARVTSIDALQTTAVALKRFRSDAASALDELDLQARRVVSWIHHDRKDYWAHELRRSEDAVATAKVQLIQARSMRRVAGHETECVDERRALARAQRRQEIAMRKVEAVRRHTRAVDHAVDVFQRTRIQFLSWLEGDLEQADAALKRMSASLESYISLGAPASGPAKDLLAEYTTQIGDADSATGPPGADDGGAAGPSSAAESELPGRAPSRDPTPGDADTTVDEKGIG